MRKIIYILVLFFIVACGSEKQTTDTTDGFNRKEMLTFWANEIIIPSYTDFTSKTKALKDAVDVFVTNNSEENLTTVKNNWKQAYISWQKVALFQLGKAVTLNMTGSLNTYPTSTDKINEFLASGSYNLESPSETVLAAQGFPALDYLLYGKGTNMTETPLTFFTSDDTKGYHKEYLKDLSDRIYDLSNEVVQDWNSGYKTSFIEASGSSITSSTDIMVNYYVIPYFEKQIRDPKIANASGAKTGIAKQSLVEAYYKKDISKELLSNALTAMKNFYQGTSFSGTKGQSLQQYLEFLNRKELAELINTNFAKIEAKIVPLNANFATQIANDKVAMLHVYDAMQVLLRTFKPDMMSAMGVQNTSTDSDND